MWQHSKTCFRFLIILTSNMVQYCIQKLFLKQNCYAILIGKIKACDQTQYAVIKKSAIRILLADNSCTGITILSVNSWTPANRKNYLSSSKNFLMFPVVPSPEYTTLVSSNLFSITLGRNSTMLLWTKEKMHF